jgi:hypothetical protein
MPNAETLWYLAPGLAHQLGNAVFTLQGRARLLAAGDSSRVEEDSRAILDGVDRAHATLDLLRWLLGEGRPGPAPAGHVLQAIADVARVPLRDRGIALELHCDAEDAAAAVVEPTALCVLATAACRALAALVPPTAEAALLLHYGASGSELRLRLWLLPAPGSPPFPREASSAADAIRREVAAARARRDSGDRPDELVLWVPTVQAASRGA